MYKRILKEHVLGHFFKGKAIAITGARQTGKTTLAKDLIRSYPEHTSREFNCDNPTDRELLTNKDLTFLEHLIGDAKIIFIDEGQKVETIGQTVKLLVDHFSATRQVLVTGSSSIHLLDQTNEALTGRKYVHILFPLSLQEMFSKNDALLMQKSLESLLIFGMYPDVVQQSSFDAKAELLEELSSSSLYKDIFEFQQVKSASVIVQLLKALALQVGSEVSSTELSRLIGVDKKTVDRYIDLLEKNFIVFRLPPYTKNKRREISKLKKIYFYDCGIRNAVINNFNFLDTRNDVGALWENFIIAERFKYRTYHALSADQYFWRTYDGSEVDLVEERSGQLYGYEMKWNDTAERSRVPQSWRAYPESSYTVITKKTLDGFVL